MKAQQSGQSDRPISIDDQFFVLLAPILDEVHASALREVGNIHNVPLELIDKIYNGHSVKLNIPIDPSIDLPDKAVTQLNDIKQEHKIRLILDDIYSRTGCCYKLTYKNERTFEINDLGQLIDLLKSESGCPRSLSISAGGWKGLRFDLELGRGLSVSRYTVNGPPREIGHIAERIRNLLQSSEPTHSWLHNNWPGSLISFLSAASFSTAYFVVIGAYHTQLGKQVGALAGLFWVPAAIGYAASRVPVAQLRRAFPPCQFEFGPETRRRATYRSIIWVTLSVVLIPLALAFIAG